MRGDVTRAHALIINLLIFIFFGCCIYSCQKVESYQIIFETDRFSDNQLLSSQLILFSEIIKKQNIVRYKTQSAWISYLSGDYELRIADYITQYKNLYEYEVSCTLALYKTGNWVSSCYILMRKKNLPDLILRVYAVNKTVKEISYFSSGKYKYIIKTKIFVSRELISEEKIKY